MFRGKLTEALRRLPLTIRGEDDPKRVADIVDRSWQKEWVVYAKKPFRDAVSVIEYLGRYTHRTAISNARILKASEGRVMFKWRDYPSRIRLSYHLQRGLDLKTLLTSKHARNPVQNNLL